MIIHIAHIYEGDKQNLNSKRAGLIKSGSCHDYVN